MLSAFQNHIQTNLQFLQNSKLLIAISGGIDSVVLAHLCNNSNLNFALAHCNFKLREPESDQDEAFVKQLAKSMQKNVYVTHFNTKKVTKEQQLSTQMAARKLRYNWFNKLIEKHNFNYVLTAHHANDNLETLLINLSRGTGLKGFLGIPEINKNIVRPLLFFSREDIENFAKQNSLKWREDSSNNSNKYLRNALRLETIPKLKKIAPNILEQATKSILNLKDANILVEDRLQDVLTQIVVKQVDKQTHYSVKKIKQLSNLKAYLYHLFSSYNFTQWNDIEQLLKAQAGKYVVSNTHRLLKDRDVLILSQLSVKKQDIIELNQNATEVLLGKGKLFIEQIKRNNVDFNSKSIFVDKNLLKWPLYVRYCKKGDYFYPFGMQGKKTLSKYFKDEKLSLLEKENIQLLCNGNNQIIWIIGKRLDNRYKITQQTKQVLKLTYNS